MINSTHTTTTMLSGISHSNTCPRNSSGSDAFKIIYANAHYLKHLTAYYNFYAYIYLVCICFCILFLCESDKMTFQASVKDLKAQHKLNNNTLNKYAA